MEAKENILDEVLGGQMKRINTAQEDIIKECLSEHYKLPLTEETYKRISCITHNEHPNISWYYLDGHKFIAMIDNNFDFKYIGDRYHTTFQFQTRYTESRFLTQNRNTQKDS